MHCCYAAIHPGKQGYKISARVCCTQTDIILGTRILNKCPCYVMTRKVLGKAECLKYSPALLWVYVPRAVDEGTISSPETAVSAVTWPFSAILGP